MSKIKWKKITMGLLAVSFLCLSGCSGEKEVQNLYGVELEAPEETQFGQETASNYKTIQAENSEFSRKALADLSLFYPVTADLVCEKENAVIREIVIHGRHNEPVKKGDVLLTFDIEVSKAEIENYSLKLQRCMEAMEEGKAERQEVILEAETEAEALDGWELELALLKIEKLKTEYDEFVYVSEREAAEYREQLAYLESEKEGYELTAPFDGVIDFMEKLNPGDRVEKGQFLIKMYAPDQYYLKADDIAGNLRYNSKVTVLAGPKNDTKTYTGKVVSAYNILLPAVPKGDPLIRLDEPVDVKELEVALRYEADIERLQNVLLIDRNVIRMDENKSYVRILENDMIQKRYILPGLRNSEVVWVVDGLSKEQKVIAE